MHHIVHLGNRPPIKSVGSADPRVLRLLARRVVRHRRVHPLPAKVRRQVGPGEPCAHDDRDGPVRRDGGRRGHLHHRRLLGDARARQAGGGRAGLGVGRQWERVREARGDIQARDRAGGPAAGVDVQL